MRNRDKKKVFWHKRNKVIIEKKILKLKGFDM